MKKLTLAERSRLRVGISLLCLLSANGLAFGVGTDNAPHQHATERDRQAYQSIGAGISKVRDFTIYKDSRFHCGFPSAITLSDGELIVAFRRAPDRHVFGETVTQHTDPTSHLVLVRSRDNGQSWTKSPELIYAHPFGGSQDANLLLLNDKSILIHSYGWSRVSDTVKGNFPKAHRYGNFVFFGGFLVRSEDGGRDWSEAITPPPVPGDLAKSVFGNDCPAYNRGAMCQGSDGTLYWAVATHSRLEPRRTETHLLVSSDRGNTWKYRCPIAKDSEVSFNETSLYETTDGDLVAFMRTTGFDDRAVVARSTNGGESFKPWEDCGWQGSPQQAIRLPDDRVLLVYGYRHKPYGIRARVLNAECTDTSIAPEIVLREDGGGYDLGYPWATLTEDGHVLVVYYFNEKGGTGYVADGQKRLPSSEVENYAQGDGSRYIAGTLLSLD